jgi:hypothetical protein
VVTGFGSGDLDGDGYGDVLVGAPYCLESGRVFVYRGSVDGLVTTPSWTMVNTEQWLKFGVAVAALPGTSIATRSTM